MLKNILEQIISNAVYKIYPQENVLVELEIPGNLKHGDYACNIAMTLVKSVKKPPREIAQQIKENLEDTESVLESVSVAGPGFLNFKFKPQKWIELLKSISDLKDQFGVCSEYRGKKALVEFVSANPTGPLHIGHGRNAVVGDTLARLLTAVGFDVTREYYVNDGGIQITTLGRSVYSRFQQQLGHDVTLPEDCYQGDYIKDLALELVQKKDDFIGLSEEEMIQKFGQWAGNKILEEIKFSLKNINVVFDHFFFESTLYQEKKIEEILERLKDCRLTYTKDGALWLNSTKYGDDKDRVLIKNDGLMTYLTPDVAYHQNKFYRGYDLLVNVWGADHAGYGPRINAALKGLGHDVERLKLVLIQMVSLIQKGQLVSMSTRRAQYETLDNVVNEVGPDVTRYFLMMRSYQSQLEFDLELAKKETSENPIYYIQYAHARICSIFRKAGEELKIRDDDISYDPKFLDYLVLEEEVGLVRCLLDYPEIILKAADELAPHRVSHYALELARYFQAYYDMARQDDRYKVVTNDRERSIAKLFLLNCIRHVLRNTLTVLGISAPVKM